MYENEKSHNTNWKKLSAAVTLSIMALMGSYVPTYAAGVAQGDGSAASGNLSTAVGNDAKANSEMGDMVGATAIGANTNSLMGGAAVGESAIAREFASVLGSHAQARRNGTAVGESARAEEEATALGSEAKAYIQYSTAIGKYAIAGVEGDSNMTRASAFGSYAQAIADQATAIGANSNVSAANSVALGYGSVANQANVVSVGAVNSERKIINVKVGELSQTSTDAVNGSQLFTTNQNVTKLENDYKVADNALSGRITAMDTAYKAADTELRGKITTNTNNITSLTTNVGKNTSDITAITTAYQEADTELDTKITAAYKAADTELDTKITAAYTVADNALSGRITTNTNDIARLTTNVGKNTSDITALNSRFDDIAGGIGDSIKDEIQDSIKEDITNNVADGIKEQVEQGYVDADNTLRQEFKTADETLKGSIADNKAAIDDMDAAYKKADTELDTKLDKKITANANNIQNVTSELNALNDNAVQYSVNNEIALRDGTKITNLANGTVAADSTDAVNGRQLFGAVKAAKDHAEEYTNQQIRGFVAEKPDYQHVQTGWTDSGYEDYLADPNAYQNNGLVAGQGQVYGAVDYLENKAANQAWDSATYESNGYANSSHMVGEKQLAGAISYVDGKIEENKKNIAANTTAIGELQNKFISIGDSIQGENTWNLADYEAYRNQSSATNREGTDPSTKLVGAGQLYGAVKYLDDKIDNISVADPGDGTSSGGTTVTGNKSWSTDKYQSGAYDNSSKVVGEGQLAGAVKYLENDAAAQAWDSAKYEGGGYADSSHLVGEKQLAGAVDYTIDSAEKYTNQQIRGFVAKNPDYQHVQTGWTDSGYEDYLEDPNAYQNNGLVAGQGQVYSAVDYLENKAASQAWDKQKYENKEYEKSSHIVGEKQLAGAVDYAIDSANSYTDQKVENITNEIDNIGGQVNKLDNRLNKVGAGAAALAALHPLEFDEDTKLSFSAGLGHYKGQNAGALGVFYRPTARVMFSFGGTVGNGENMANLGVSFALDRGVGYKAKPTNNNIEKDAKIAELSKRVDELIQKDKENAELRQRVEELTRLVNQMAQAQK